MIKRANHKWARDVDAFIRPPVCVSWNIRGIFFQTSSHLTLHVCWSCPVQFITGVNVTFILAMTVMHFSTCHSRVRIIPRVICFVLHVLPSPGTYRCASELRANSTLKRTWTGDSFIKHGTHYYHREFPQAYLICGCGPIISALLHFQIYSQLA